ncbi:MAG: C39 family peptidase [Candidatus Aminicenantes bacterium]|nr:MAG: C39 family peptidase [Candidatus Aminicenantes bacterium]
MRRAFGFLILICLTLSMVSCFDGPWTDVLDDVPYCPQEQYNYCAIACIQMWAWYDRHFDVTQNQIANYIGIATLGSYPENVVEGVNAFTDSYGFMVEYNNTNIGQDHCIAACIAAIKDFTPAIMPFYGGPNPYDPLTFDPFEN